VVKPSLSMHLYGYKWSLDFDIMPAGEKFPWYPLTDACVGPDTTLDRWESYPGQTNFTVHFTG